jgi:hypothetical protein
MVAGEGVGVNAPEGQYCYALTVMAQSAIINYNTQVNRRLTGAAYG